MLRRTAVAGSVVLAVGLVLGWLGGLVLQFGSGEDGGDGGPIRVQAPQSSQVTTQPAESSENLVSQRVEREEKSALPREFVEVLIDEESYLTKESIDGRDEYRPIALNRLIELARSAPGNDAGVRVRIARRGSSIARAEEELEQALLQADIPREAIDWQAEIAP